MMLIITIMSALTKPILQLRLVQLDPLGNVKKKTE